MKLLQPRDTSTLFGGGVYELEGADTFSVPPDHFKFRPYELVATYGRSEPEEVAARIITLCQQWGGWVALDYNVLCRMVADELVEERIQSGAVFSLILLEMARIGSEVSDWINRVIAEGIFNLKEKGYIVVERVVEGDLTCDIIMITPKFFDPIQRFAALPA